MSGSLLQHQHHALFTLLGIAIFLVSFGAYSDSRSLPGSSLSDNEEWLERYETDQQTMNVMWMEQGMRETSTYYESNAALKVLAKSALKKYWQVLVHKNQTYDRYTPVVSGHFSSSTTGGADFDLSLTGNTVKLHMDYSF